MSNFLALLIKANPAAEDEHNIMAGVLVFVNVMLLFAVAVTAWLAAKEHDYGFEVTPFDTARAVFMADQIAGTGDPRRRFSGVSNPLELESHREESSRTVVHVVGKHVAV